MTSFIYKNLLKIEIKSIMAQQTYDHTQSVPTPAPETNLPPILNTSTDPLNALTTLLPATNTIGMNAQATTRINTQNHPSSGLTQQLQTQCFTSLLH